ncbi:MAG: hypothetical protein Q8921_11945 [Bacteroidota bacterium]|nr:hypothetical protein [Bacteroidota bacterium]
MSASWIGLLTGLAVLAIGLYHAIDLKWVSDDAFITFRYVENFLAGLGPVYNAGERVEGYTDFLWFVILSIAGWFGADLVDAGEWLGIAAFAGTLLIYLRIAKVENDRSPSPGRVFLPLAALLLGLNREAAAFATGGLETSLFTFLISLAFYLWFYSKLPENWRLLSVGVTLILTTLTRPDGALFTVTAIALLFLKLRMTKATAKVRNRSLLLLIAPSLLLGLPYLIWKRGYYGSIFPNTYYQKSGGLNYFEEGFYYISLFVKVYWSATIAVILLPFFVYLRVAFTKKHRADMEESTVAVGHDSNPIGSPVFGAAVFTLIYLFVYVAKVGGDFMFGRFIVPILPLAYFIIERSLGRDSLFRKYQWPIAAVLATLLIFEGLRPDKPMNPTPDQATQWTMSVVDEDHPTYIADERYFYTANRFQSYGKPISLMQAYSDVGRYYEPFFRGLPVSVMGPAAMNMITYYAKFSHCIDQMGLCDSFVAHMPLVKRGPIGHEKSAPMSYLHERGVHFKFGAITFSSEPPTQKFLNVAYFAVPGPGVWQTATVVNVDTALFSELNRRFKAAGNLKTYIPDYPSLIPDYIANVMPQQKLGVIDSTYSELKSIYFSHYPNPVQQKQIEDHVAKLRSEIPAAPEPTTVEGFLKRSMEDYQNGYYDKCIADCKAALQIEPNIAIAYVNICAAYNALGIYWKAEKAGEEALRLDPNNQMAKDNLKWAQDLQHKK